MQLRKLLKYAFLSIFLGVFALGGKAGAYFIIYKHSSLFFPIIGIRVNDGKKYTNQRTVDVEIKSLKLADSLITEMRIGTDPDLSVLEWIKYNTAKVKLDLTIGDGEKMIFAQLRDKAGNVSPVESTRIILDTTPPEECKILINKDEKYTRDEKLRVVIFNVVNEEISEMMFSNNPDFLGGSWEPYAPTKNWLLEGSGGDGLKKVYCRFKDMAGNVSDRIIDEIILDTTPPQNGYVIINNNDKYTRIRNVKLKIHAEDAVMVRVVSPNKAEVFPYTVSEGINFMELDWEIDSLQGTKVVRVYFMDVAKNRTTQVIQDEIIFDNLGPPAPFLSMNGDSRFTNSPNGTVSLKLSSRVSTVDITMMISNYIDFQDSNPIPFSDNINNWKLLGEEDGVKTVYAKFIDEAGNHSEITSGKIILDRVPPKVNRVYVNEGSIWTISQKVNVHMDVEEASFYQISNTEAIARTLLWEPYIPTRVDWIVLPPDGEKIIYTRFKDAAGNESGIIQTKIVLDTQPPMGEITINDGSKFTNSPEKVVRLKLKSTDAKGMQISNKPDFSGIELQPFSNNLESWPLEGEDGPKTVFVRLKDEAGNFSNVITSTIILDREPPSNLSLIINEGQEWVRNPARRASVQTNANGASMMMIGENPNFPDATWLPFKATTSWVFSEGEGEKELYIKFMDPAGNISQPISNIIKVDYTPPVCEKFDIENGADFTNHPQKKVVISISSADAVKMAISNTPIEDPTAPTTLWENFVTTKDWILEGEDGLKTIYAVFRDEAGNFSARYNDRIILDRIGPSNCSVVFNNNQKWVPSPGNKISLELTAEGADRMILTEDPGLNEGRWEMYVPRKIFEVSTGDGEKTIYVKFVDKAGNESPVFTGKVTYDSTPPEGSEFKIDNLAEFTNNTTKTVAISVQAKEAKEMRIAQKGFSQGVWEPFASSKTITLDGDDGEKELAVFFRDEAGNVSDPLVARIILDRTPPLPVDITIDNGAGWTNHTEKKVTLQLNVKGADEMMLSNNASFEGGEWIPFKDSVTDYVLPGEDGEKIIFAKFRDKAGNISPTLTGKINLKRSF